MFDPAPTPTPTPVPTPTPTPTPTPDVFELNVAASSLTLVGAQSMTIDGDHIGIWGHPGEAVTVKVHTDYGTVISVGLDYVLARESGPSSKRAVTVSTVLIAEEFSLDATCAIWDAPTRKTVYAPDIVIPPGDTLIGVGIPADQPDGSNWLDLYALKIKSDHKLTTLGVSPTPAPTPGPSPVPSPTPTGVVVPTPPSGAKLWHVPADGSYQSVLDRARGDDFVYVDGILPGGYRGINRNAGDGKYITVIGNPGHVLRSDGSGMEMFGSCRGWKLINLNFEVAGSKSMTDHQYNSGVSFYGGRTDGGADGAGAQRIHLLGVTINPIAGTGTIARDGITMWGADVVEIGWCQIGPASFNILNGDTNTAGSGISLGESLSAVGVVSLPNGARAWVHHNNVRGQRGPGSWAVDRNGINLDNYYRTARPIVGLTLIEYNDIADCEGRGICAMWSNDVLIRNNLLRAPLANNLNNSLAGGIVSYGGGQFGSGIEVNDNDVQVSPGFAAYFFEALIAPVKGARNKGGPINGAVPVGFSV